VPHGLVVKRALRLATVEDMRRGSETAAGNADARRRAMERVRAHGLVMKLSDAEWQWDRKKVTFYFTAEKRVDFRQLVRDLAAMFRARIELKQIGVRDEAKRLDGIGRCGRQYCSAVWLPELRPVNLGVAKDQRLSLNPSQISGACGRLMCSLRYEHDFYVQSRKRFPKEGKILATSLGEEKVVANDIFNDRVTLRTAEGDTRVVELAELKREMAEAAGTAAAEAATSAPATAGDPGDGGEAPDVGARGPGTTTADGPPGADAPVEVVLAAAAAADGEIPVSLPPERTMVRPSRPLREADRRVERQTPTGVEIPAETVLTAASIAAPSETSAADSHAGAAADVADDATEGETDAVPPGGTESVAAAERVEGAPDDAPVAENGAGEDRRPRRRRGRRGGRRGRGPGSSAAGDAAGTSDGGE
jgi:cell fate regulator YaaT (PSP1 superfamily)